VKILNKNSLKNINSNVVVEFWEDVYKLSSKTNDLSNNIEDIKNKINLMIKAYERGKFIDELLQSNLLILRTQCLDLEQEISGSKSRSEIGEKNEYPSIWTYLWAASGSSNSTYGPTKSHRKSLIIANTIFKELKEKLNKIEKEADPLEIKLEKIKAPLIKN